MKRGLAFFRILVPLLLLAGCADAVPAAPIEDRLVLGFAQTGDESEYRTSASNDIRRAAEDAGVQLMFENAQQKQFNQIKAIRSFILNGVDVIAFSPLVEDGWDNVLLEAKAAGIPVILVDRYIKTEEEGLYCAFIGSDFRVEGVRAASWMVEHFAGEEGPVLIAELTGTANSSPTIGRHDGLLTVLLENPKFQIAASVSGDFMRSKGKECMEKILETTPDVDVLFSHNDDMALGAIEVIEEHGITPGEDIAIISFDGQNPGLDALRQGKINCIVECNPYVGDKLMTLAEAIAEDRDFPAHTYVEERIFTDGDAIADLPERS